MKKLKLKLTEEQLKSFTKDELIKKITAGYTCPTGYYWDNELKQCILDVG